MQTKSTTETLWLDGVLVAPSPNYDERPECSIDLLVIHNISLPPGQFGGTYINDFFCNQLDCQAHPFFSEIEHLKVSAHFLIDRQGQVTQFVPVNKRAWHAGVSEFRGRQRCNDFSIGIEMEGTDDLPYTEAQYQSLKHLTKKIQRRCPAITNEQITGHSDISPGRKTDPGPCFDWEKFHALLQF